MTTEQWVEPQTTILKTEASLAFKARPYFCSALPLAARTPRPTQAALRLSRAFLRARTTCWVSSLPVLPEATLPRIPRPSLFPLPRTLRRTLGYALPRFLSKEPLPGQQTRALMYSRQPLPVQEGL